MNQTKVSTYGSLWKKPTQVSKENPPLSRLFICEGDCIAFYVVSLKCDEEKEIRAVRQNKIFEVSWYIIWVIMSDYSEEEESGSEYSSEEV